MKNKLTAVLVILCGAFLFQASQMKHNSSLSFSNDGFEQSTDQSQVNRDLVAKSKSNTPMINAQSEEGSSKAKADDLERFEELEQHFARLNTSEARKKISEIDQASSAYKLKNYSDFSDEQRTWYLNLQRQKAVLLKKIIVAQLERIRK